MLNNNGGLKKGGLLFEIFWLCSPSTLLFVLCLSLSLYLCPLQVSLYLQQFLLRVGPFPRRASSLVSLRGQSGRTAWTLLNFTMDPCAHLILAHWPTILSSEACWLFGVFLLSGASEFRFPLCPSPRHSDNCRSRLCSVSWGLPSN